MPQISAEEAARIAGLGAAPGTAAAASPAPEPTRTIDALVVEEFGGEPRRFRLTVPWLAKVEADCDAGPLVIAGALAHVLHVGRSWAESTPLVTRVASLAACGLRTPYVGRTLFWGLVGGGMEVSLAAKLVRGLVEERGWPGIIEHVGLAFAVITGASVGPEDDQPTGEPDGAAASAPPP